MTDRHYTVQIYDKEDEVTVRDTTLNPEDVESVGGIGSFVESLESIVREGEQIRINTYWK